MNLNDLMNARITDRTLRRAISDEIRRRLSQDVFTVKDLAKTVSARHPDVSPEYVHELALADLPAAIWVPRQMKTGGLIETVDLDGDDSGIGEEELEQFIASFPIDPGRAR